MTPGMPLAAIGALALLALTTPASARAPVAADGSREAASCIVRRDAAFAAAWLDTLPASDKEADVLQAQRKTIDGCLKKVRMTLDAASQPEIRRATAGALLMRNFARLPAAAPFPAGTAPWFAGRVLTAPNSKYDRATLKTEDFANCVALSQWPETVALLAAPPAGATQAAEALRPSIAACLTSSLTVTLKIASLRAMLAEAVYHILTVAGAQGAAAASAK